MGFGNRWRQRRIETYKLELMVWPFGTSYARNVKGIQPLLGLPEFCSDIFNTFCFEVYHRDFFVVEFYYNNVKWS
jgi:hypothetical protein